MLAASDVTPSSTSTKTSLFFQFNTIFYLRYLIEIQIQMELNPSFKNMLFVPHLSTIFKFLNFTIFHQTS